MPDHSQQAVLVAEGDAAIRALLSAIVQRLGLEPVPVRDAEAAAALLDARTFAALVIDLPLPGDGHDRLLFRLSDGESPMLGKTVVLVSALRPPASYAGAGAVLRKPFALHEITEALRRCCAK